MQSIRAWLAEQSRSASTRSSGRTAPTSSSARRRSTIQRSGPIAAAKVPLTPGRSVAVDRLLHTFGTPSYIDAPSLTAFGGEPFRRLMIAQDTGSAIVGPARGDLFAGSGDAAGEIAGVVRNAADFYALLPKRCWSRAAAMSRGGQKAQRRGPGAVEPGGEVGEAAEGHASRSRTIAEARGGRKDAERGGSRPPPALPAPAPPKRQHVTHVARPADARQAVQGQAADRGPRRPARHDPERGAFAAAVLPAAGACQRRALCAGHHRQGIFVGRRRGAEARRCRPGCRRRRSARWCRATISRRAIMAARARSTSACARTGMTPLGAEDPRAAPPEGRQPEGDGGGARRQRRLSVGAGARAARRADLGAAAEDHRLLQRHLGRCRGGAAAGRDSRIRAS